MDILIVTGMSGAGKSQAVTALEDIGYYCVDNVPPALIPKFAELSTRSGGQIEQMALVVDVRSQGVFEKLLCAIELLEKQDYVVEILFLEADTPVLATRYKETRRRHPLMKKDDCSVEAVLEEERKRLQEIRSQADYLIDTSMLSAIQLRDFIRQQFLSTDQGPMSVTVISFGFKYATPKDIDLLFDVRGLKNPYYIKELRSQTGLDSAVEDYVMQFEEAQVLLDKIQDLIDYLVPLYIKEGKTNLVIGFGCTGGKHRSVVFAQKTAQHLKEQNIQVTTLHRDIDRH